MCLRAHHFPLLNLKERMVARHAVTLIRECGLDLALLASEGAAWAETATLGRVDGARRLAGQLDGSVVVGELGVGDGDRVDQRLRVGMLRILDHLLRRSLLDDAAQIHDADAVRHVLHDCQIVADEQVGQAQLSLQILHEVKNLRLNGHVQGGDRLVGDDQVGCQGQRASKTDALELSARELVGVAVQDFFGQADLLDDHP